MKSIIDNFSERAKSYARFRPVYPENLYDFVYSHVQNFDTAWDCGTGNGQVAVALSEKFKKVFATDVSDSQLALAPSKPNIFYSNTRAEKTDFPDNSFDLITVAQAIHWFDQDAFFKEVFRVAKPNSILALWGYNLLNVNQAINLIIADFYINIVGPYWDAERTIVDEGYSKILFPFYEISAPDFEIEVEWNFEQFIGYLSSWSSVNKYQKVTDQNPLELI
ncbi:MAG: class I SAM-dependent methyltransferase, partial [Bacteroidia bacterium]